MKYLTFKTINDLIEIYFNDLLLGYYVMDVDGFYYFKVYKDDGGLWSDYILKEITDKLFEINKDWKEEINKILK